MPSSLASVRRLPDPVVPEAFGASAMKPVPCSQQLMPPQAPRTYRSISGIPRIGARSVRTCAHRLCSVRAGHRLLGDEDEVGESAHLLPGNPHRLQCPWRLTLATNISHFLWFLVLVLHPQALASQGLATPPPVPAPASEGKRNRAAQIPQTRAQTERKLRTAARSSGGKCSCARGPGSCSQETLCGSQARPVQSCVAVLPHGEEKAVQRGPQAPGFASGGSQVPGTGRDVRAWSQAGKGAQGRLGNEDLAWMEAMGEEEDENGQAVTGTGPEVQAWRGDAGGVPALNRGAQALEGPWQEPSGSGDSAPALSLTEEEDPDSPGGQLYWGEEEEEGFEEGPVEDSTPQTWASAPGSPPGESREASASSLSDVASGSTSSSAADGSLATPWDRFWAKVGEAARVAAWGMASALWPVLGFVELVALAGVLALQFLGMFSGRAVQAGGVGAVSFATAVGQGGAGPVGMPWKSAQAALGWQNMLLVLMLLVVAASRLILLGRMRQGQEPGPFASPLEGDQWGVAEAGIGRRASSTPGAGLGLALGVESVGRGDLEEQVRLMEGDLSSTIGMLRALSRHVEKLGVHVRLTRRTLRDPMMQTAEQVEFQGRQVEALEGSVVALQSNLEELQLIVVCVQDQCMRQFGLFSQALRNVQGQLKASQEKSKAVAAAAPPKRRPAPPQGSGQDAGPGSAERGSSAGPRAPNGRRGGPGQGGGGRSRSAVRGSGAEKQRGSGQNGSFSAPRPGVGGPVLLSSSEGPREDYWASA